MKKYNIQIAIAFGLLTILFLILAMSNTKFFEWIFARHQNQLSWYIRPIFIIPFCYFAYRRNWTGISITIFCLFTSMFWFKKPEVVSDHVKDFLQFEKDWLYVHWEWKKVLFMFSVPVSFAVLGFAFWKRSMWIGLAIVVLMATGKVVWSIQHAGESGKSIVIPAVFGLLICFGLIVYGFNRLEKNKINQ
jgi:hypothetical protein